MKGRGCLVNLVKCPYPDCTHVGDVLTDHHCRTEHNAYKSMIVKEFGPPQPVSVDMAKLMRNTRRRSVAYSG